MVEVVRGAAILFVVSATVWTLARLASHAWHKGKMEHFKRVWEHTQEGE